MKICPICESSSIRKLINWSEYDIYNCQNCELIFTSPLPSDALLQEFYQGFLFNKPDEFEVRNQIEVRKKELVRLFSFKSELKNKSFLDYGGGTGSAYKAACELKLKSYYHDLDEQARLFVKERHGLTDKFIIERVPDEKLRFDYIFSDNVIEHVKDPIKYLIEMREALANVGEIVVKTPHGKNTESLFIPLITMKGYFLKSLRYNSLPKALKAFIFRFWHCDPPRHLYAFSKTNLKLLALKAGFKENEIEISYYRIPFLEYSLVEIFFNIRRYSSAKYYFIRVLILPLIPIEFMSRVIQVILVNVKLLTPGGIILKLKK